MFTSVAVFLQLCYDTFENMVVVFRQRISCVVDGITRRYDNFALEPLKEMPEISDKIPMPLYQLK